MKQKKFLCALILLLVCVSIAEAAQSTKAKNIASLFREKNPTLTARTADRYADIVIAAARKYKQDPYVIAAIIVHESTVNAKAVSKGGDYGLMQVRYRVHEKAIKQEYPKVKKAEDMFNARTNIFFGTRIFSECASKTTTTQDALMRYSGGSTNLTNKAMATVRELQAKETKRKGK